jgi:hypothetical protein
VYKGKPTHHKLVVGPDGSKVNKSDVAGVSNIDQMVKHLRAKRPYWPIPLGDHVAPSGGSVVDVDEAQVWLHEVISNDSASSMLSGRADGHFLIRKHKPGKFVVSVVYKGNPTHHLISEVDGMWKINKAELPVTGLSAVIKHLRIKQKYWPVPLTNFESPDSIDL